MKSKVFYPALLLFSTFLWSCSQSDVLNSSDSGNLKSSLTAGVQNLNSALSEITSSPGFQVLTNNSSLKSATTSPVDSLLTNQILLSDISGVYDYKVPSTKWGPISSQRYFSKTASNSLMIVRLPQEKVESPRTLFTYSPSDTLLTNNYVISVSDYLYKFRPFVGYDYRLASGIKIKDVDAGNLKIWSTLNYVNGYDYLSEFDFPSGYVTKCYASSGDTAVSSYSISKGGTTLYEEKYTATRTSTTSWYRERSYSLTIGDVQIVRAMGKGQTLDSAKVYVKGVLQAKSKVEVINKTTDTTNPSFTHKTRDLKITFDDGTSSTLTDLEGAAIDNISSLFTSMRQVNFATDVVDWIAWDIYRSKK
ncbi:MAG: hypothetical protein Q8909_19740 [Bacteroidota bacterium]|nr:hypothetical protein [Bacteroidota bacterium]